MQFGRPPGMYSPFPSVLCGGGERMRREVPKGIGGGGGQSASTRRPRVETESDGYGVDKSRRRRWTIEGVEGQCLGTKMCCIKGAIIGCELPPALVTALNAKNKTLLSPAHQPQPETCFYDLPPELRNYIYELAMENNLNTKFTVAPILPVDDKFQEPSILLASKQIRIEAGAMFYGSNVFKFLIKGKIKKLRKLRRKAPNYRVKTYLARALRWIRMICCFNGLKAFRNLLMIFERDLNRSGLIEELVGLKYATGMQVGILSGFSDEEAAETEQKGGVLVKCKYWSANKKTFARVMLEVAAKAREEGWTPAKLQEEFAIQFDLTFPEY